MTIFRFLRSRRHAGRWLLGTAGVAALVACQTPPSGREAWPLALAPQVDLPRFMGDWYVIGSIGTSFQRGAYNAKDTYKLDADGTVDAVFTFRADGFTGPMREFHSRGYVLGRNNAVWGRQYFWPIKADYRISHVSPDYTQTVITREKRDYLWIMARTPAIPEADYQKLVDIARKQGYDPGQIRRMPQSGS